MKRIAAILLTLLMIWEMIPAPALAEETYYGVGQTPTYYTVVFADADGSTLKQQFVAQGESATAPDDPVPGDPSLVFSGWRRDPIGTGLGSITANTTFTAEYEPGVIDNSVNPTDKGSEIAITLAPKPVDVAADGVTARVPEGVDVLDGALLPGHEVRATFAFDTFVPFSENNANSMYIKYSAKTPLEQVYLPCSGTTKITSYTIVDTHNADADVTSQYDVSLATASYSVGRIPITIRMDAHQVYTGVPEYGVNAPAPVQVGGTLRPGDYLTQYTGYFHLMPQYKNAGLIPTDVGDYIGYIDARGCKIFAATGDMVQNRIYAITVQNPGDLYIEPRPMTITVQGVDGHVYDGQPVTPQIAFEPYDQAGLRGLLTNIGHTATAVPDTQPVDVGTHTVGVQNVTVRQGEKTIPIENYRLTVAKGTVRIVPRPISIFVPYAAMDQDDAAYHITDGSLADGDTLAVTTEGGVATARMMRGDADVTANYDITLTTEALTTGFTVMQGQAYQGTFLNAGDAGDAGDYSFAMPSSANGTVAVDGNDFTYTPKAGFSGEDALTYTFRYGSDAQGNALTVDVPMVADVVTVNTAPAFVQISGDDATGATIQRHSLKTNKNSKPTAITCTLTGTDAETPASQLVYAVTAKSANADLLGTLTLSAPDANGKVTCTFLQQMNAFGTASYTISLTDLGAPSGDPDPGDACAPKSAEKPLELIVVVTPENAGPGMPTGTLAQLAAGPAGICSDNAGYNTATLTWTNGTDWETAPEHLRYIIEYNVTSSDSTGWTPLTTVPGVAGTNTTTLTWPKEAVNTNTLWVRIITQDDGYYGVDIDGNEANPAHAAVSKTSGGRRSNKLKMDNAAPVVTYTVTPETGAAAWRAVVKLTIADANLPGMAGVDANCVTPPTGAVRVDDRTFLIDRNGDAVFAVTDKAGNVATITVPVTGVGTATALTARLDARVRYNGQPHDGSAGQTYTLLSGALASGHAFDLNNTYSLPITQPKTAAGTYPGVLYTTGASILDTANANAEVTSRYALNMLPGSLIIDRRPISILVPYAAGDQADAVYHITDGSLADGDTLTVSTRAGIPSAKIAQGSTDMTASYDITLTAVPLRTAFTVMQGQAYTGTFTTGTPASGYSFAMPASANATVSVSGNDFTYTPKPGFSGVDALTYTFRYGTDAQGNPLTVTVPMTVTVLTINAAPAFVTVSGDDATGAVIRRTIANIQKDSDPHPHSYTLTGTDAETPASQLSYAITGQSANADLLGTLVLSAPDESGKVTYTFTPLKNVYGKATYTLSLTDRGAPDGSPSANPEAAPKSAEKPLAITFDVQPQNAAPYMSTDKKTAVSISAAGAFSDNPGFNTSTISWENGYDTETAPDKLTYNIEYNITNTDDNYSGVWKPLVSGIPGVDGLNSTTVTWPKEAVNTATLWVRVITQDDGYRGLDIDGNEANPTHEDKGKTSGGRRSNKYKMDNAAPVVTYTVTPQAAAFVQRATITLTVADADLPGMAGLAASCVTTPSDVTRVNDKTYTVYANGTYTFRATDKVGNVATIDVVVDCIQEPTVIEAQLDARVVYNGQPRDGIEGVAYRVLSGQLADGHAFDPTDLYGYYVPDPPVNAGTYTERINITGAMIIDTNNNNAEVNDHYIINLNWGDLVIDKRPVTVTVLPAAKRVGDADPAFTVAIEQGDATGERGALPQDLAAFEAFYAAPGNVYRTDDDQTVGVKSGVITARPIGDMDNYDVTVVNADLDIQQIPLTIRYDAHLVYNGDARDGSLQPTIVVTDGALRAGHAFGTGTFGWDAQNRTDAGEYLNHIRLTGVKVIDTANNNADVTGQYQQTIERPGDLYIAKRPLAVTLTAPATRVYNGLPLVPVAAFAPEDSAAQTGLVASRGHVATATLSAQPIAAGTHTVGVSSVAIKDGAKRDITANYDWTANTAQVVITKRPVTVTVHSATKRVGDADPAFAVDIEQGDATDARGVLPADVAAFTAFYDAPGNVYRAGGDDSVGTQTGVITALPIDGMDNYDVTVVNGDLVIEQIPLTIRYDAHRVYDGAPHDGSLYPSIVVTDGALRAGHAFGTSTFGWDAQNRTDAGAYLNHIGLTGVQIIDTAHNNADVTDQYRQTIQRPGDLYIAKRPLAVTLTAPTARAYNGQPLLPDASFAPEDTDAQTGLVTSLGHSATATLTAQPVSAGTHSVGVSAVDIRDGAQADITANYDWTANTAQVVITPRPVTVTVKPSAKMFGQADPPFPVHIEQGNATGDRGVLPEDMEAFTDFYQIEGKVYRTGTQNDAGFYPGVLKAVAYTGNANYAVTVVPGDFVIQPLVDITVRPDTVNRVYNGNTQSVMTGAASVVSGALEAGHTLAVGMMQSGSGVDAGDYPIALNAADVRVMDGAYDVTYQYAVTTQPGVFTIARRPINIHAVDMGEKPYIGAAYALNADSGALKAVDIEAIAADRGRISGATVTVTTETTGGAATATDAGTYPITVTAASIEKGGADISANFVIDTGAPGQLVIAPRRVTVTADAQQKYERTPDPLLTVRYDSAPANPAASDTGVLPGDAQTFADYYTVTHPATRANAGTEAVGVYPGVIVPPAYSADPNYIVNTVPGDFTILARVPLTIASLDETRVYTAAEQAVAFDQDDDWQARVTVTGLAQGDRITQIAGAARGTDAGTYPIALSGIAIADANGQPVTDRYDITLQQGLLTIAPRPVLVQGVSGEWMYDGLPHLRAAEIGTLAQADSGLAVGHKLGEVTLAEVPPDEDPFTVETAYMLHAGSHAVTPTAATITTLDGQPVSAANYDIRYQPGTVTVTKRPVTVTIDKAETLPYGTKLRSFVTSVVNGYEEAYGVTVSGLQANDYMEVYFDRGLTGDTATVVDIGTYVGNVMLVPVCHYACDANPGDYLINFQGEPYTEGWVPCDTFTAEIAPRRARFAATRTAVYDGQPHAIRATDYAEDRAFGSADSDYLLRTTQALTLANAALVSGTDAGTYPYSEENTGASKIRVTKAGDGLTVGQDVTADYDYRITGTLTIAQRPVAISVISEEVPYTSAAHTPRTAVQPIAGDANSGLPQGYTVQVDFTGDNAPTEPGTHAIALTADMVTIYDAGGNDATANFALLLTGGTLTIGDPTVLSIALTPMTVPYDGAAHTAEQASVVPTGLKPGHSIASLTRSGAGTDANTVANPSYVMQASDAVITDGTNDVTGEYTISYPASTLVITPRALTITADTLDPVVYDAQDHSAGITADSGLVSGHSVSDITLTDGVQRDAGSYTVVPSAARITDGADDVTANYAIAYENGGITINPRPLTVALNDPDSYSATPRYGDAPFAGRRALDADAFTITGLAGDDRFAQIGLDYGDTARIGAKTLTLYHTGVADAAQRTVTGNYDITVTQPTIAYTVLPRTLVYTASKTVTYDGRPHSIADSEFALTGGDGLAPGDTASIVTAVAVPRTDAGSYPYTLHITGAATQTDTNVRILKNGDNVIGNYVLRFDATLDIARRPVTFAMTAQTFAYDTAPHSLGYSVSAPGTDTGLLAGHSEQLTFASNSRTAPGTQTATISAVRIFAGQDEVTANYVPTTSGAELTIGAQPVVSLKPALATALYNAQAQTAPVTTLGVTSGALRPGDAIAAYTPGGQGLTAGNYANLPSDIVIRDNNGSGKDVTAYYALTPVAGTFSIARRPVTVRVVSVTADYDAAAHTATYRIDAATANTGLVGDDTLSATLSGASRTDIGANAVTFVADATRVTSAANGDVTDSYAVTEVSGSIELTRPMRSYTVRYYYNGAQDDSKTDTFTAVPYGTQITAYTPKPVSGYVIDRAVYGGNDANTALTLGLDDTANRIDVYYVPTSNMAYTVSYVLRGTDGSALGTIAASKTVREPDLRAFDRVAYYDDASQVRPTDRFYEVAPVISGYTYVPSGGGSIQIGADETRNQIVYYYRRNVAIKANDDTRVYNGQAQHSASGLTVTGLPNGWALTGVTVTGEGNPVGTYTLSPTPTASLTGAPGQIAPDCRFTYQVGTLTITARPASAILPAATFDYNGTAHTVTPVVTGLADGHTLNAPLIDAARTAPGSNPVTFATGEGAPRIFANTTDVTANYTLTTAPSSITVTARAAQATITARTISAQYSGSTQTGNGVTAAGLAAGDYVKSVTVNGEGRAVGTYTLTPTNVTIYSSAGVDVTANYPQIVYVNGALSITPRPLTIAVQSASYPYDGTAHSVTYSVDGSLAGGEQITNVVLSSNTRTEIGSNTVNIYAVSIYAGSENTTANYVLTRQGGSIAVTQRNDMQYRVEYYFGGVKQSDLTEYYTGQTLGAVINSYPGKPRAGYALSKVLYGTGITNSLTIALNSAENVIRVFYEPTGGQSYTIEYYVANLKGTGYDKISQDVVGGQTTGAVITDISQRIAATQIGGIVHERTDGLPLTVSGTPGSSVIRVYYARRATMRYRVEYYYDGDIDAAKTETVGQQLYGQVIYGYHDKLVGGYKLARAENLPLTLGEDEARNVIRVYYEKIGGGERLALIEDVSVPLSAGVGGLNAGETKD